MEEDQFSYRTNKDDKVFLYWHGKQVKILKGNQARKFVADVERADEQRAQLLMARATGNFKRGNERPGRRR